MQLLVRIRSVLCTGRNVLLAIAAAIAEALPDVVTSLPLPLPLPPADVDAVNDANANTVSVSDTQSNNHPRATDPSTREQGIKREPLVKTEPLPANSSTSTQEIKLELVVKPETARIRRTMSMGPEPLESLDARHAIRALFTTPSNPTLFQMRKEFCLTAFVKQKSLIPA
jgi:hypothetical protein